MRSLLHRAKDILSLSRVQAILGIIAATLSIGGFLYGYLRPAPPPSMGEIALLVQDVRTSKPVPDATIEVLTSRDALVTTLTASGGQARQSLKEGNNRLSHPRFATETRQVQVIAGQVQEIQLRLTARAPTASGTSAGGSPLEGAGRAVDETVDKLKKIFR